MFHLVFLGTVCCPEERVPGRHNPQILPVDPTQPGRQVAGVPVEAAGGADLAA